METTPTGIDLIGESLTETKTAWIVLGIVGLLTGLVALVVPGLAALATTIVLGVVLGVGGIARLVHAFQVRRWSGFFWELLLAALYLVASALIITRPIVGMLSLALIVSVWCIAVGVVQVVTSLHKPRIPAWGWMLTSGIAGIVLGLLILSGWPAAAVWAVGLLVGLNLVFTGISELMIGMSIPRLEPPEPTGHPA